ncbi:MAG: WD40/YVTN/BNR-like repeat-containing protein [Actinomycetota bacterium]
MRRLTSSLIAVSVVASLAATVTTPRPRHGRAAVSQLLGGPGAHPERPEEWERAQEWLAAPYGGLEGEMLGKAQAAAQAQSGAIRAGTGTYGRAWRELGPKPYVTTDTTYNDPYNGAPPTGWKSVSGRVTALAVDPSDPSGNTVWQGTAAGGVWLTRDGGRIWRPIWDSKPSLAIGAIAFDQSRPRTLYVGTGDGTIGRGHFTGTGVYRSTDGGRTFTRTARNVGAAVISKIVARNGKVFVGTSNGLWRSTDAGSSYHDARLPSAPDGRTRSNGPFANFVSDVVLHPDNANEVTAVIGFPRGEQAGASNGLYRSIRGGAPGTFARMAAQGLGESPEASEEPLGRMRLAYASGPGQNHDILWAIVQDAGLLNGMPWANGVDPPTPTRLNGIYRSADDGATWTLKATVESFISAPGSGLVGLLALYSPGIQAWYDQWIAVSPKDSEVVLVGLEEIYQTTGNANGATGLATWKTIGRYWNMCLYPVNVSCTAPAGPYAGETTTHADQHSFAFANGGTRVYVGNDGGVFVQNSESGSFANEWDSLNDTIGATQAYYAQMGSDGTVYAGFQDNGIGKITPDGRGIKTFVGDGGDVAIEPSNSDHAWSEYVGGTMFKTSDGGRTWINVAPELTGAQFIAPFEMDPLNEKHVALGGAEVVETTRGVDTTCPNEFLVTGTHAGPCDWVTSFTFGNDPASGAVRTAIAIDVHGPVVYAGVCGVCTVNFRDHSTFSKIRFALATNRKPGCSAATGSDACWHFARAKGLPNRFITDVTIDPRNPSIVYVVEGGYAHSQEWIPLDKRTPNLGRGHVFVSRDAGETFRDISANLPNAPVRTLEMRGDRLFVGTDTGIYTSPKAGAAWERLGRGIPNTPVFDLNFNPQKTVLLAATFGRGMWSYSF